MKRTASSLRPTAKQPRAMSPGSHRPGSQDPSPSSVPGESSGASQKRVFPDGRYGQPGPVLGAGKSAALHRHANQRMDPPKRQNAKQRDAPVQVAAEAPPREKPAAEPAEPHLPWRVQEQAPHQHRAIGKARARSSPTRRAPWKKATPPSASSPRVPCPRPGLHDAHRRPHGDSARPDSTAFRQRSLSRATPTSYAPMS